MAAQARPGAPLVLARPGPLLLLSLLLLLARPPAMAGSVAAATHYSALGLSREASSEDVRKEYKRIALRSHPDRNVGRTLAERTAAEAHFKAAAAAYETLSDEAKRREYDASLSRRTAGARGPASGGGQDFAAPPRPHRVAAIITVRCTLQELFSGACKRCNVPGLIDLTLVLRSEWQNGHAFDVMCPDGRFARVKIAVRPHADFARRGGNLLCTRFLTRSAAARGACMRIRAIDGRILSFRPVSKKGGSWQDGQRLAWRGAGMYTADGRGDLILTVRVASWPAVLLVRAVRVCTSPSFIRAAQALIFLANVDSCLVAARSCGAALHRLWVRSVSSSRGFEWAGGKRSRSGGGLRSLFNRGRKRRW
ncbi:hypothetical protein T492DRAFT_1077501 [Pavlovales sp. CCMP2436]|nr:hypothetical protein T492DRAFT_1077501 [Pavlovales sp. CCMP2436]|mmetsp:Transcript_43964/g.108824  ORF Transcript_43964/g.108824 Transcript_43964/m.108824 type:complete len:366 (+) Transcript_43964:147-1244(+)